MHKLYRLLARTQLVKNTLAGTTPVRNFNIYIRPKLDTQVAIATPFLGEGCVPNSRRAAECPLLSIDW